MHFHFSVYSSLLLIFFSQGLIFSFLLLKKGILLSCKPCKWLSFFVFICSLYLLPWMLGFAGWYSIQPYRNIMFYIPFQQLFLIGPAIFFYTKSLLNPDHKFEAKDWMHFIPAAAYVTYRMVILIVDVLLLNEPFFYADGKDKNLDNWYQIAGFISMLVYLLLSLRYYSFYKKIIFQTLSFADTLLFAWVKKYLLAFLLMQILWLLFFCFYPQWGNFKEKWWYYLSFSVLLYYIGITGYTNNIKSLIGFKIPDIQNRPVYLLDNNYSQFEHENLIEVEEEDLNPSHNDPELEDWKRKIRDLIEKEKLYRNQNLTFIRCC